MLSMAGADVSIRGDGGLTPLEVPYPVLYDVQIISFFSWEFYFVSCIDCTKAKGTAHFKVSQVEIFECFAKNSRFHSSLGKRKFVCFIRGQYNKCKELQKILVFPWSAPLPSCFLLSNKGHGFVYFGFPVVFFVVVRDVDPGRPKAIPGDKRMSKWEATLSDFQIDCPRN